MDINVTNLDLGYTKCSDLNNLAKTDGEKLISDLEANIINLKNHWKGSDAKAHISNLITVYDAMVAVVTDAKKVTSIAGDKMIAIQKVRQANGGVGTVGESLPATAPNSSQIAVPADTTEYYCDPAATADESDLSTICTNFSNFKENFSTDKDELLSNWTAGAGRENAVSAFNSFVENAETYKSLLNAAKENLSVAVGNISKLG